MTEDEVRAVLEGSSKVERIVMHDDAPASEVFTRHPLWDAAELRELGHYSGLLLRVSYPSGSTFQQYLDEESSAAVSKVLAERRSWRPKRSAENPGCGGCGP